MQHKKYLLILIITSLFVVGCFGKKYQNIDEQPKLLLSLPEKLELKEVKFAVITTSNCGEKLEKHRAYFALSENDYKAIAINMKRIQSRMILQKQMLEMYQDFYEKE